MQQAPRHLPKSANHLLTLIAILGSLSGSQQIADAQSELPSELPGIIKSVTVYSNQANVVREIKLKASNSAQQIRVPGLPIALIDQSLRWESDGEIDVRSIRLTKKFSVISREEREGMKNALQQRQQAVQDAAQSVAVIEQDLETLENLIHFSSKKTQADLERSQLDVESVSNLADFVMKRRRALAKELHDARRKMETRQSDAEQEMRRQGSAGGSDGDLGFEALLSVNAPGGGSVRISYWVDRVKWKPAYTIHAESGENDDRFIIRLNGTLAQNSGEDWNGVELSFCTGSPDLQAAGPTLAPLRVTVNGQGQNGSPINPNFTSAFGVADESWEDAVTQQRDLSLNSQAATRQIVEFNQRQGVQRELASDAGTNIADETYRLAGNIDIKDGTRDQNITVLRAEVKSPIYRVVTPLLSSFAYREALLSNSTGQNLVGGEATVLLNGRFIGRTTLPPTAAGGEFKVGLGADRQIRTRRELLSRQESIKGGNQLSDLRFRLVVSNFHDKPIDIRLYDRVPISDDEGLVNVITSPQTVGQLSDDARYRRLQQPTGILRWDLQIPAKRFGSKAYDHSYQYTVETERSRSIVGNDLEQQLSRDLRFKRSGGGGMGGGMGGGGSF